MNLIDHARQREGWQRLTPTMQERIEHVLTTAHSPDLGIIATDNQALRQQLCFGPDQWTRIAKAMKAARLLDVQRNWTTDGSGQMHEHRPASWIYTYDDSPRASQTPRQRRNQDQLKIRRLESEVGVLTDEVKRLQSALLREQQRHEDAIAAIREQVVSEGLIGGTQSAVSERLIGAPNRRLADSSSGVSRSDLKEEGKEVKGVGSQVHTDSQVSLSSVPTQTSPGVITETPARSFAPFESKRDEYIERYTAKHGQPPDDVPADPWELTQRLRALEVNW